MTELEKALEIVAPQGGDELVPGTPWTRQEATTLVKTVAPGLSAHEFQLFAKVAESTGLNPFLRQIHAVKRGSGKDAKLTIQTGIDGLRLIAHRTGECAGISDAEFEYEGDDKSRPALARVVVKRITQGTIAEYVGTARWSEFYPGDRMGFMWKSMPHVMLGKCAEAQALRKAFPAETSGLYADEEMHQADRHDAHQAAQDATERIKAAAAVEKSPPVPDEPKAVPVPPEGEPEELTALRQQIMEGLDLVPEHVAETFTSALTEARTKEELRAILKEINTTVDKVNAEG